MLRLELEGGLWKGSQETRSRRTRRGYQSHHSERAKGRCFRKRVFKKTSTYREGSPVNLPLVRLGISGIEYLRTVTSSQFICNGSSDSYCARREHIRSPVWCHIAAPYYDHVLAPLVKLDGSHLSTGWTCDLLDGGRSSPEEFERCIDVIEWRALGIEEESIARIIV